MAVDQEGVRNVKCQWMAPPSAGISSSGPAQGLGHEYGEKAPAGRAGAVKGSTGLIWRDAKWEHVSSQDVGSRFLISHLKARAGGEVRVLTGHFSCESTARKQQWVQIESKLSSLPSMPLVVLADHNSVMVLG